MPPNAMIATRARQAAMTKPNLEMSKKETMAAIAPTAVSICPRIPEAIAVRETRKKECGLGGAGGTMT
jgi:hypothetical protein